MKARSSPRAQAAPQATPKHTHSKKNFTSSQNVPDVYPKSTRYVLSLIQMKRFGDSPGLMPTQKPAKSWLFSFKENAGCAHRTKTRMRELR